MKLPFWFGSAEANELARRLPYELPDLRRTMGVLEVAPTWFMYAAALVFYAFSILNCIKVGKRDE